MNDNTNLAEEFIKYMKTAPETATWNSFFDHCHVPEYARNDFAVAAILKGVQEIENKNPSPEKVTSESSS